ncbi:ABC transporter permease [Mycetocola tolaasinivorans]|uniref:ABC transporter permease n=1 Tax=Mycetocola tolaasinivorans TaxID=76635 RepID=A0A3L7A4M3_9MICO|nr:ABC transporter permease [Mycetocola tolaasinivorans]RLP75276.1 ABC transporter permease [Mycetocola tolaasinivorans]
MAHGSDTLIDRDTAASAAAVAGEWPAPGDTVAPRETDIAGALDVAEAEPHREKLGARLRRIDYGLVISVAVVVLVLLWALVPSWFTPYDPILGVGADAKQPPSGAHPFGTDAIGRDIFARVVHGSALSLQATALAIAIAFVVSAVIGLLSGYVGGWVDEVLMRIIDVLLSIPSLLLSLILITALGFGTMNVAIAVGIGSVAAFSRVLRSEVLKVRTSAFVEAAKVSGVRWWSILIRHVFPHAATPILGLVALEFGAAILAISALNFLGYGAKPPTPEWGTLVADGRSHLASAWWMTTLPGLVIAVVVLAAAYIGRTLENRR